MRKHAPVAVIVLLVGALVGATVGSSQSAPASRQQWEYWVGNWAKLGGEAGFQRLGAEGWELVAATEGTGSWYYFKRPK